MQVIPSAVEDGLAEAWHRFCGDVEFVEVRHGSILDASCDGVVSPANSFGFIDSGIHALYKRRFGSQIQESVQSMIRDRHHGELVVGAADLVETGDSGIPYLIVAPTKIGR